MSPELRDLLRDATSEPAALPSVEATWAAGRSRRRTRLVASAVGSVAVLVGAVTIGIAAIGDQPRVPEIVDQPTGGPTPAPSEAPAEGGPAALPGLDQLAVASTLSLDDGGTYESRFPDGTLVRSVPGVTYPDRLWGLPDGTVVWQTGGIFVLGPDAEEPSVLVPSRPDDPAYRLTLVGVGERDGQAVVLVEEARAESLVDDEGGVLWAYDLEGSRTELARLEFSWEAAIEAASMRDGWLLYTQWDLGGGRTILRSPDGTETVLAEGTGPEEGVPTAVLAEFDVAPGTAVLTHVVEPATDAAPFGAARLEARSVLEPTAEPVAVIELPTDAVPKQLTPGSFEFAYLTLLPDVPQLLQVSLITGEVERFAAPGIVAVHTGLQPRPDDAPPSAACADAGGAAEDAAQAYVWLPCPDAATGEQGDDPATRWGIHQVRLVTDPRASDGGVAQRIEAMLGAIFVGPTAAEEADGYSGIIDPAIDALVGVTFADGVATIELTEAGARAASIGTAALMSFEATLEVAIFHGFVDVEAFRITVEGDCDAWGVYGQRDGCPTYPRDGTISQG